MNLGRVAKGFGRFATTVVAAAVGSLVAEAVKQRYIEYLLEKEAEKIEAEIAKETDNQKASEK